MTPVAEGYSTLPKTTAKVVGSGKAETDKLYSLADVDPIGSTFEGLWWGPPKSGKTCAAATLPPPFRWLDADRGLKSVRWAYQAGLTQMKDPAKDLIAYRPIEGENPQGYVKAAALDRATDMLDHWFSPADVNNWQTLVIDSFTEVNDWAINKGLELNARLPSDKKPLSRSHATNLQAFARLLTGQQDYKSAMAMIERFLYEVRIKCAEHGKNLITICHQWIEEERDEDGNRRILQYEPLLIGQHRERLPKSFDDVWFFEVFAKGGAPEIKARVHKDPLHYCGTRWGAFLPSSVPPHFPTVVEMVKAFHDGAKPERIREIADNFWRNFKP